MTTMTRPWMHNRRGYRALIGALGAIVLATTLAACGVGNPWPTVDTAPATNNHVVLAVGDSLLGQGDYTLIDTLNHYGYTGTTVFDAHINGTGLIGPVPYTNPTTGAVTVYPSALAWLQFNLAQNPSVDTVVMEYGGACASCDQWVPGSLVYGSDAFYNTWLNNAKAIIDFVHAQNLTVFWVKSPQSGASGDAIASGAAYKVEVARWLSAFDELVLSPYAGTPKVDWWYALNDTNGQFQQVLNYDGAEHQVRYADLVHIMVDGSTRASTWTVSTLGHYWSTQVQAFLNVAPTPNRLVQLGDPVTAGPMWGTP